MTKAIQLALDKAAKLRPHYVYMIRQLHPVSMEGSAMIAADRYMRLYFDPDLVEEMERDFVAARILVQIEHYYRRHSQRQRGREQVTWDVATEIAVTDSLAEERIRMIPETLFPSTFNLEDSLCAEQYQALLLEMCSKREGDIRSFFEGLTDIDLPASSSASSEFHADWEIPEEAEVPTIDYMIAQMAQQSHEIEDSTPGKGAGREARIPKTTRVARIDWEVEFRGFMGSLVSTLPGTSDYSYSVPDPDAAFNGGFIMPGMVDRRLAAGVIIDTSQSMGDARIAQAIAETGSIVRSFAGAGGVFVYSVDTAVHSVREVFHDNQIELVGGGGTDMGLGIRAAATHFPRPNVIVVITDGDTFWPDEGPRGIPVIVVLVGNGTVPDWVHKAFRIMLR